MAKKKDIRIMAYDKDEYVKGINKIINDIKNKRYEKAMKRLQGLERLFSEVLPPCKPVSIIPFPSQFNGPKGKK